MNHLFLFLHIIIKYLSRTLFYSYSCSQISRLFCSPILSLFALRNRLEVTPLHKWKRIHLRFKSRFIATCHTSLHLTIFEIKTTKKLNVRYIPQQHGGGGCCGIERVQFHHVEKYKARKRDSVQGLECGGIVGVFRGCCDHINETRKKNPINSPAQKLWTCHIPCTCFVLREKRSGGCQYAGVMWGNVVVRWR